MSESSPLVELVEIFRRLRAECAWKAAQTHRSLAPFLLEETYETLEAIESLEESGSGTGSGTSSGTGSETGDLAHLCEELGDLLLQVYLHAAIAAEAGAFDIDDVAAGLREKMIHRNPHVFADPPDGARETDPDRINERWQALKAGEKQRSDVLDGIPDALPALARAAKVLDRLSRAGRRPALDPDSADLGERLLVLVDEAARRGEDPEQALREAVRRISR